MQEAPEPQSQLALITWQQSVTQELRTLGRAMRRMSKTNQAAAIIAQTHSDHLEELNGKLKALETVKDIAPQLELITQRLNPQVVDRIVQLAESKAEDAVFWRGVKKRLNPLKPIGALIWTALLGGVGAMGYTIARILIIHQV